MNDHSTLPGNEQTEYTNKIVLTVEKFMHLADLNGTPQPGESKNPFPVDIFPHPVQDIIKSTNETLNYPVDFIGSSLLGASAIAIGNSYNVEVMKGYIQNAVIYLALVGMPGTAKSHALSFALRPISKRDGVKYKEYMVKHEEYQRIHKMTETHRKKESLEVPDKPVWDQVLISDFTPEALADVHKNNPRGIGVYCDELASWFLNFNRYTNGSAEQFWLTQWSGKPVTVNRKASEPTHLALPFIPVLGTIQPGVLQELAKNRTQNGFIDRILFVFSEHDQKSYWNEEELNQSLIDQLQSIMANLLNNQAHDNDGNIQPTTLRFAKSAKEHLQLWQRVITDKSNAANSELLKGIYAKMEQYCIRFSLILELLKYACVESAGSAIGIESVQGAIKLVDYFLENALKVHEILNASPVDRLTSEKRELYETLPEIFKTHVGIEIAEKMNIPKRTFKAFLTKQELFQKLKHGEYEKRF